MQVRFLRFADDLNKSLFKKSDQVVFPFNGHANIQKVEQRMSPLVNWLKIVL